MQIRDDENIPKLVSINPKEHTKRTPVGIYDSEILCEECEKKFSRIDNYGVEILLLKRNEIFTPIIHKNEITAYSGEDIDQELIFRFLISVLWRASISKQDFYKRIYLGPFEKYAMDTILKPEEPIPNCFSAVLSIWAPDSRTTHIRKGILDPYRKKIGQINAYDSSLVE